MAVAAPGMGVRVNDQGCREVMRKAATVVSQVKVWDKFSKLLISINDIAQHVLKAFKFGEIAMAINGVIKQIATARSVIKLGDFVDGMRLFLNRSDTHDGRLGIAAGFFGVTGNIGSAVGTLAKLGCFALKEVVAKGLSLISCSLSLVSLGVVVARLAYNAVYNLHINGVMITLIEKVLDTASLALVVTLVVLPMIGIQLVAAATIALSVTAAALSVASCCMSLYASYQRA